ncbi:hypothetical protein QZH41_009030 [Actinostola sp. cb2023]|nr:hypothetical protein QZH41_009030 [Actinostola sp. cb2023]
MVETRELFLKAYPHAAVSKFSFGPTFVTFYSRGMGYDVFVAFSLRKEGRYPYPAVDVDLTLKELGIDLRAASGVLLHSPPRPISRDTAKHLVNTWLGGPDFHLWSQQLNLAVWCTTAGCGVTWDHLEPDTQVAGFLRFHTLFTVRQILTQLGTCPPPWEDAFHFRKKQHIRGRLTRPLQGVRLINGYIDGRTRLDLAISPELWLFPSHPVINRESVFGCNNGLKRATPSMHFGINDGVNSDLFHRLSEDTAPMAWAQPVVSKPQPAKPAAQAKPHVASQPEKLGAHEKHIVTVGLLAAGLGWWAFR